MPQLHFLSQTLAEAILSKAVTEKPHSVPTAATQNAMDKWLKAHQAQFKAQAVAFKKQVAEVCNVLQNSSASKAAKFGLSEKLAGRMSITTCRLLLLLVSTKLLD